MGVCYYKGERLQSAKTYAVYLQLLEFGPLGRARRSGNWEDVIVS